MLFLKNKDTFFIAFQLFVLALIFLFPPIKAAAEPLQAELNAYQLSLAASGAGANSMDPSVLFYNPAALVNFHNRTVSYSTIADIEHQTFTGHSNWYNLPNTEEFYQEFGRASSHELRFLPSFNEAIPFNDHFALGLGLEFPFGSKQEWSNSSVNRYVNSKNSLLVMDLTPNIGYRVNSHLALGAGLDADYANSKYDTIIGQPSLNTAWDSLQENKTHGWGVGGHFGILYNVYSHTQIGLTYYTPISIKLHGTSSLGSPLSQSSNGVNIENSNVENTLHLPASVNLSFFRTMNRNWDILSSLSFTHWNAVHDMEFESTTAAKPYQASSITSSILPLNLEDSWRLALGTIYHWQHHIDFHGGFAFLNSPFEHNKKSIFNMNNDSLTLACGSHYQLNNLWSFDLGYAHRFYIGKSDIEQQNIINNIQLANIQGDLKTREDLVGLQVNWNIGAMKSV